MSEGNAAFDSSFQNEEEEIDIIIRKAGADPLHDFFVTFDFGATILDVYEYLSEVLDNHPTVEEMRLISKGKLLHVSQNLKDVVGSNRNPPHLFHLVVKVATSPRRTVPPNSSASTNPLPNPPPHANLLPNHANVPQNPNQNQNNNANPDGTRRFGFRLNFTPIVSMLKLFVLLFFMGLLGSDVRFGDRLMENLVYLGGISFGLLLMLGYIEINTPRPVDLTRATGLVGFVRRKLWPFLISFHPSYHIPTIVDEDSPQTSSNGNSNLENEVH